MKLKTLRECYMSDGRNFEQVVREEAIKWLKIYYHPDKTTLPMRIWLDFHNITEEDLK